MRSQTQNGQMIQESQKSGISQDAVRVENNQGSEVKYG